MTPSGHQRRENTDRLTSWLTPQPPPPEGYAGQIPFLFFGLPEEPTNTPTQPTAAGEGAEGDAAAS